MVLHEEGSLEAGIKVTGTIGGRESLEGQLEARFPGTADEEYRLTFRYTGGGITGDGSVTVDTTSGKLEGLVSTTYGAPASGTDASEQSPWRGDRMPMKTPLVSFVLPQPTPPMFPPWSGGASAIQKVRQELDDYCQEQGARYKLLHEILSKRLIEARASVMRSGENDAFEEAVRIQGAIDELEESPALMPTDQEQWQFTSHDAKVCLRDYFQSMDEATRVSEQVRLRLAAKLDRARADVMRRNRPGDLIAANRIQATIDHLESSADSCLAAVEEERRAQRIGK